MGTVEVGKELTGGNEERIFVSVRLRPPNAKEIYRNDVSEWECINDDTIVYKNAFLSASERCMYPTAYTFDRVFRSNCSTREVYEKGAKNVAISVLSGMNSTVFAYGQTSSGKTYTMTGVTEYALADIYEYIRKNPEREFVLKFSAMEIYNESVRDLLSMDITPLRLLDDPERGTIVEKLTEEVLRDWDHVIHLLSVCEAQRQIGETSLNEMSSRSHQIIRLTIESSSRDSFGRGSTSSLAAAVNFVDLAGSERASQSLSAGTKLKEGCHINRSLLTLGTVIRKLSKGRGGHIPFRDSKLTRILQMSLGGNARTAIICTMSPARSHIEQSRNTLLFASCAKEVTTNAQVNVIMSDKALVKYLQSRVERLENELRSPQCTFIPSNISMLLREKDIQIEKLEKDVNDLILQRDIAQSKVKDLLQVLADNACSVTQVGYGHYPNLRFRRSTDNPNAMRDSSILADPCSSVVDTRAYSNGHSETSSEGRREKVSCNPERFVLNSTSPRFLASSSSISESYSFNGLEEIEKHSDVSEDLCKEVRRIETAGAVESSSVCSEENNGFLEVHEYVNGDEKAVESPPTPEFQEFRSAALKNDGEISRHKQTIRAKQEQEQERTPAPLKEEHKPSSIQFVDTPSNKTPPLTHEVDKGSSMDSGLKLTRSRSCEASIFDLASSLFKTTGFSENTSSMRSEREYTRFDKKLSPLSFESNFQSSSTKDPQSSPENNLDTPDLKLWIAEDFVKSFDDIKEKAEVQTEEACTENQLKLIEVKTNEQPKRNAKDVRLDPIEHAVVAHPSWTIEFKILQQEIIELWHACKVSLIHRTYFFMLFKGDPLDSIYVEVERRRMKFLKNKFSQGNKAIVNGQLLTLTSSAKALHEERKFLSRMMKKKFSKKERGSLFLKWGISINTKHRRLQLAHCLWTKTEDIDHVADSAFLVAKLIAFVEPGEAPSKEMFGLNFTTPLSTGTYGFKRSITSLYDLLDSCLYGEPCNSCRARSGCCRK